MARHFYASQGQLAKRLGISQQRQSKLIQDPEWHWGKGPWTEAQATEIDSWLQGRRAGNNATASNEDDDDESALKALSRNPEKLARIKLVVERTAKIKLERELLAGGYLKKEEVEKDRIARVFSVRAKLQEMPLRASLIAHKTEAECERILNDWMREACEYYASGGT